MKQPEVSVIIISYNVQYFLELCLDSVFRALKNIEAEVIVVDNASADGSVEMVRNSFPQAILIVNKENVGFSRANNQAVDLSNSTYVHFLNPDTILPEDFYDKSLSFMNEDSKIGGLGPRLIDGKGNYAIDSKKSFPDFWTSVYKAIGLSKIFPRSPKYNRYYAAHVDEWATAEIDILSGCCMLLRRKALEAAGGGFNEQYFMYCEDVDLSYQIKLAGYKNFYFPETTVLHYKGESTRKITYRYMRIFNDAFAIFVKKYYPRRIGKIYLSLLNIFLLLKSIARIGKYLVSIFRLPFFDAALLLVVSYATMDFWTKNVSPFYADRFDYLQLTFIFIGIWLFSMFFSGAYDKPHSFFKAGRGMIIGTMVVLALYGLFPVDIRFSRGTVFLSGIAGTVAILAFRWILSIVGIIQVVPRGKNDYSAAIVTDYDSYKSTIKALDTMHYSLRIAGRISPYYEKTQTDVIGNLKDIQQVQASFRLNEFIFNPSSISYADILSTMERCKATSEFKIHVPNSKYVVGKTSSGDSYSYSLQGREFKIKRPESVRNKRVADILLSAFFLFTFFLWMFYFKKPAIFFRNCMQVLVGKKTWVGYGYFFCKIEKLPYLKHSISPHYPIVKDYIPNEYAKLKLAKEYAREYSALDDIRIVIYNLKYLDSKMPESSSSNSN